MRRLAGTIAIVGFFLLALIGWMSEVPLMDCALRAAAGAVVIYIVVSTALKWTVNIMVEAAINSRFDADKGKGSSSDTTSS